MEEMVSYEEWKERKIICARKQGFSIETLNKTKKTVKEITHIHKSRQPKNHLTLTFHFSSKFQASCNQIEELSPCKKPTTAYICSFSYIHYIIMSNSITQQRNTSLRLTSTAGALASFLTQPFEVMKTNRINTPATLYLDLHRQIVSTGWKTYMKGSSIAVARQAYGFTVYTQLLARLENQMANAFPNFNKVYHYSVSSVTAKLIAMVFQAPLTLLKTRMECVASSSMRVEFAKMINSPIREFTKGLGPSVARQGLYTLFHYNTYRYLKDQVFMKELNTKTAFIPAFCAGLVAILVSQPFEVIRSRISLKKVSESALILTCKHMKEFGIRGFFIGFLPRLLRKPVNSGICWSVVEWSSNQAQKSSK